MSNAPLNIDCFPNTEARFDPKYRFKEQKVRQMMDLASGVKDRNGGIFNPQRIHMRVGRVYFRFCDSKKRNANGAWWIDGDLFGYLQHFARQHDHIAVYARKSRVTPLAYAAKLHLAVPFEWGDTNYIVAAVLQKRMDAYAGRGNIAYLEKLDPRDGGAKYIPIRDDAMQMFVPDMHVHFDSCMRVIREGHASWFA